MAVDKCKIHFTPDNLEIVVDRGTNLLSAAQAAGVHISASCDSLGVCGTCKVKIESGSVKSTRTDKLTQEEYDRGIRQACRCQVISDLTVNVPIESRVDRVVRALERSRASGVAVNGWKFNPPVKKYLLNLPSASRKDNASDYFRIMYALKRTYNIPDWPIDFEVIRKLPAVLRAKDWQVTITMLALSDKPPGQDNFIYKIINAESGDTRGSLYGVSIDIGTVTICAQLLDLNRGRILAETRVMNKQILHGADILPRIAFSQQPDGLSTLQAEAIDSINEAIDNLVEPTKFDRNLITYISTAGNTTLQHLLVGLPPGNILRDPFIPVANFIPLMKAREMGLRVPDHTYLYSFPNVSSFVGGDITAGIVASGIRQRKKLTLYMDIGTCSGVVIGNSEWMVSTACLNGSVFEGIGIKNGMTALPGAIVDVSLNDQLEAAVKIIGDGRPEGLCGAGLISATAALLSAAVIGPDGRFMAGVKSPHIRLNAGVYEFVLVKAASSNTHQDIVISEKDIEKIIQAKAAIYATAVTLAGSVNVEFADIDQFIIAGNLGSVLDIEKAVTVGLLPDVPRERFVLVGNGSLTGTRLITFSTELLEDSRTVAQMLTDVEMKDSVEYKENYAAALSLPNSNAGAFPSVIEKLNFT